MASWKVYCVRCERRVCIAWPTPRQAPGGSGRSFRISDVVPCEHANPWAEDFDFTWAIVGFDPVLRVERRT